MILTPGFGFYLPPFYCSLGYMQSPVSGPSSLLSEHEPEKYAKVALGGLTRPLLGSWTGIFEDCYGAQAVGASVSHEISHMREHYSAL